MSPFAMDDEAAIRQRIDAFLADALAWSERNAIKSAADARVMEKLEVAEGEKEALVRAHCASLDALASLTLCYPPDHSPHTETIQSVQFTSADAALVETSHHARSYPTQFEYEMVRTGQEWRISSLREVFADKTVPPSDAEILEILRRSPQAPLLYTELPEGLERLFEGPCTLTTDRGEIQTEVSTPDMTLSIPSGWISCDDPSHWDASASTFEIDVPPGEYPLQIVQGNHEPVAVKLLIQPTAKTVRYCKATRLMAEEPRSVPVDRAYSNSIGARSGRISLADAASLYGMSHYDREKMENLAYRTQHTTDALGLQSIKMSNGVNSIRFDTGNSGGFSAYWALDAKGAPIALYFDLPHLATTHQGECAIPILSNSQISFEHPILATAGITVRLGMDGASQCLVIAPREYWAKIAVSDPSHRVIINFDDHFGSSSSPEENCSYFPPDFQLPVGGLLHIRWNAGHSYEFALPLPQTTANTPEAFGDLWHRCGCEGDGCHWQERFKACYKGPPARHYHNWRHLTECLVELGRARSHFRDCNLNAVEMALWFHDVVYEPRAKNNEEKSAEGATYLLKQGKAPEKLIEKVSALILATKTHPHEADPDTALLLDIDLSILGQPPERCQIYEGAIRSEYQWVPFAIFAHERRKILARFLERESIFLTPYFRDRYEAQARVNLQAALENLPALPV